MAKKNKQEWDTGYQAAIEAIKQLLDQGKSQQEAADSANQEGMNSPNNQNNSNNGNKNKTPGNQATGGGKKSRTSKSDENQGVVRPEDCIGPEALSQVPGTAGAMMDRNVGDEITEQEGYDKDNTSETSDESDWKDAALKAAKQMGLSAGNLKSKIEGLYKPTKNWKKELQKVVGYSISPDDKRQAYANKNVLITQDRIARTDKDKYDNVDYIIAFIDSSGSMQDDQLKLCLSEVYQIALLKKPLTIWVIQCDTKIQDIQKFNSVQKLKQDISNATVKGRGGTNFKDCWKLLKEDKRFKGRRAELAMLFTDGWCDQYKRDPRTMLNLCWVILDNPGFELQHKDIHTKCVYLNTADIK